jgi:hypothetical protein
MGKKLRKNAILECPAGLRRGKMRVAWLYRQKCGKSNKSHGFGCTSGLWPSAASRMAFLVSPAHQLATTFFAEIRKQTRKMIVLRLRLIFPTLARDGPARRA